MHRKTRIFHSLAAAVVLAFGAAIFGASIAGRASAADTEISRYDSRTQTRIPVKYKDLGDGTYAEVHADAGVTASTGTYRVRASSGTSFPASFDPPGAAQSWIFSVRGGSATFKVGDGDSVFANAGDVFGDTISGASQDIAVTVTDLADGATYQILIGTLE